MIEYYEGSVDKTSNFVRTLWMFEPLGILTWSTRPNGCAVLTSVLVACARAIHALEMHNTVATYALNSMLFDITIRVTKTFPQFACHIISALDSALCAANCGTMSIKDDIHMMKTLIA